MVRQAGGNVVGKRHNYRDHIDPEYRRWGRKYPRFPGVAECVRLIRAGKARGSWADIIADEMARHASLHLPELIETFRTDSSDQVRLFVMMALEMARLPESIPFLAEVLRQGNSDFTPYAERGLRDIDTPQARAALWEATHG
jgi:hypothetical protein